jgi:isoleucyl-tRNA synthetase
MQENAVYQFWKDNNIFYKSIQQNKNNETYVFFDGPPFATGLPHYGHILAGLIKDTVTRYHHNLGLNVPRHAGIDTHGLPIEYEIEKEIGIKTTDEILNYGIENYNDKCKGIVLRYSKEWEETMGRLGRWIDFKNDYKTMTKEFMNSVWWVFKQLYNKNRIYEGIRIMPYSTTCGTPLSNFETQQNYQEVQDDSLFISLPLVDKFNKLEVSIMVWTTTPWTLPANYALCVNNNIDYSIVEYKEKYFIVASNLIENIFKVKTEINSVLPVSIIDTFKGNRLVGLQYLPPFDFLLNHEFKILADDYVSEKDGTGIVHIAPAYGEDDHRVCIINNLINKETKLFQPLDVNGYVSNEIPELKGMFYKNHKLIENKQQDLNTWVIIKLKEKGYYYDKRQIIHNYPFCWRSDTPLIYRAVSSWFVKVEDLRDDMFKINQEINWVPNHVGEKRFNNWLANARDWGISRSRFWGTPIPIWKSDDGDIICVESSYELEILAGLEENSISDLHRDKIDDIIIVKNGKNYKRIKDILDCWFESGSMPYAALNNIGIVELLKNSHYGIQYDVDDYPFIKTTDGCVHKILPADFIAEGIDQTRGWFYTLLVLSTSLFKLPPFKNVIVNGLVLAEDGKKMSKRLKNYPDPIDIINEYGSDCLRMYLLSSPASKGETLKFSKAGVHSVMKDIIIPLSNTIVFWKEYYQLYFKENKSIDLELISVTNPINIWILIEYGKLRDNYNFYMLKYSLKEAINCLYEVVEIINNGYIKLGRNLLKGKINDTEWLEALRTLYYIIKFIINDFKSIIPFFTEKEYLGLRSLKINDSFYEPQSIHLNNKINEYLSFDKENYKLANDFNLIYNIIWYTHKLRGISNISLKKPIKDVTIITDSYINQNYLTFVFDECNILDIHIKTFDEVKVTKTIKPIKALIFKKHGKNIIETYNKIETMNEAELEKIINNGYYENFDLDISLFNISYLVEGETANIEIKEFTLNNNKIIILLNKDYDESLDKIYYYRLIATNIQKTRKNAGLHPWDPINVYFENINSKYNLNCTEAIEYINKIIRVEFKEYDGNNNHFYHEEYNELGVKIYFVKI